MRNESPNRPVLRKRALRGAKRAVTRFFGKTALPSTLIGPPKRCKDTAGWIADAERRGEESGTYQEVIPAEVTNRALPISIEQGPHWKFAALVRQQHPPCFVVRLTNGRVWGANGAVITSDDTLLVDVSREGPGPQSAHSSLLRIRLGPVRTVRAKVAVIATAWPSVYFHWLFDVLPRVYLLRLADADPEYYVLRALNRRFQEATLKTLDLERRSLIDASDAWTFHLRSDELLVPSLPSALDTPRKWACDFLRATFSPPVSSNRRRLYISRASASGRHVLNEREVIACLSEFGFDIVIPDLIDVADQAAIFASADVIIAPHGAALANIVFCEPGTIIIDMFSPNYVNPCYWVISEELRLRYSYIIGDGKRPPPGVDPDRKGENLTINIRALLKLLSATGVSLRSQ